MTETIDFFVAGEPKPKGSTRAFYIKKLDRVVTTNTNKKTKTWEERVRAAAIERAGDFYEEGAIGYDVHLTFYRPRIQSLGKRTLCLTRPDLDKYVRAILDAVTGILFEDDSQVIHIDTWKKYAKENEQPGVKVSVIKVREPPASKT